MAILLTPQDYAITANDCKHVSCVICGHNYNFWCKSNDFDIVNSCLEKINSVVSEVSLNNKSLPFDKVLLSSFIEVLALLDNTKEMQNTTEQKYEEISEDYVNNNNYNETHTETNEPNNIEHCYLDEISEKDKKINDLEKIIEKKKKKRVSILEEIEKLKAKLEDCYEKINIEPDI